MGNIEEKIEFIISELEYIANSAGEAEDIVSKAKEMGYKFSWKYYEEAEVVIVKFEGYQD